MDYDLRINDGVIRVHAFRGSADTGIPLCTMHKGFPGWEEVAELICMIPEMKETIKYASMNLEECLETACALEKLDKMFARIEMLEQKGRLAR